MSETNAHGTLCINGVFKFLLLIFRNVYIHIGITHLYYVFYIIKNQFVLWKTKDENFFIGKSRIKFEGDNLEIDRKSYKATPGLMNLITMEVPKVNEATKEDKDNYLEILNKTGALYKIDKNGKVMIKAPRSDKYRKIIKPWHEEKKRQIKKNLKL